MSKFNRFLPAAALCALTAPALAQETAHDVLDDVRAALNGCRDGQAEEIGSCAAALMPDSLAKCSTLQGELIRAECTREAGWAIRNTTSFGLISALSDPALAPITCEELTKEDDDINPKFGPDEEFLTDLQASEACQAQGFGE